MLKVEIFSAHPVFINLNRRMCGMTNKNSSPNTVSEIKSQRRMREIKLSSLGDNKQKMTYS